MTKRNATPAPAPAPVVDEAPEVTPTEAPAPAPVIQPKWSVEAYRSGDAKVKGKIRSDLEKAFKAAVASAKTIEDMVRAQAIQTHLESLKSTKSDKVTATPEEIVAARIANLRLAADLLESGTVRPDGIESVSVTDLAHEVAGRFVSGDLATATKIASAKITKSGPQHNVAEVIEHAFEGKSSGTFLTVAQIAAASDYPHQGAVAARLFPAKGDCTVDGVVPGRRDESDPTSPKGARKA